MDENENFTVDENECICCDYYDKDEGVCGAFECNGLECPLLPCEMK